MFGVPPLHFHTAQTRMDQPKRVRVPKIMPGPGGWRGVIYAREQQQLQVDPQVDRHDFVIVPQIGYDVMVYVFRVHQEL